MLRSLATSALVLAGATACSRPDRGDSGDNSTSMAQDTASIAPDQTGSTTGRDSATGVPADAPPSARASPSAERRDTSMTDSAAGYRAMDRDPATVRNELDSARVTHDSSETSLAPSDTAAVESSSAAMARDTSTIADQIDTLTISHTAGTLQASIDTSHNHRTFGQQSRRSRPGSRSGRRSGRGRRWPGRCPLQRRSGRHQHRCRS